MRGRCQVRSLSPQATLSAQFSIHTWPSWPYVRLPRASDKIERGREKCERSFETDKRRISLSLSLPTLSQSPFSRFLPWDEKEQEMRERTEMNFAAMG